MKKLLILTTLLISLKAFSIEVCILTDKNETVNYLSCSHVMGGKTITTENSIATTIKDKLEIGFKLDNVLNNKNKFQYILIRNQES